MTVKSLYLQLWPKQYSMGIGQNFKSRILWVVTNSLLSTGYKERHTHRQRDRYSFKSGVNSGGIDHPMRIYSTVRRMRYATPDIYTAVQKDKSYNTSHEKRSIRYSASYLLYVLHGRVLFRE